MHGGYTDDESVTTYADLVEDGLFDHEATALSHLGSPPGRILDLGCGAGRTVRPLRRAGFDVVGLDVSRMMVESARELVPESEYVHASATDLPFGDATFDHVLFSFNGLDCIPTEHGRILALEEAHRVLRPGGRFVFSSHNSRFVVGPEPLDPRSYLHVAAFWLANVRRGTVTDRYKYDPMDEGPPKLYFITPEEQRRQVRRVGFDPVATVTRFGHPSLVSIDPWPYYVAEKR